MSEMNMNELEQVAGGKSANQYVKATGDVYVRKAPSLDGEQIGLIKNGNKVPFYGEIRVDKRGVAWYKVNYNGSVGWVSSKYSKLVN